MDVEPLVAAWNTDEHALRMGVSSVLGKLAEIPSVEFVVFATNSRRQLFVNSCRGGVQVRYVATAGKPFRTSPFRALPSPLVVVGDQIATDGMLAWRLGQPFVHYAPPTRLPVGPLLMREIGRPLAALLRAPQP